MTKVVDASALAAVLFREPGAEAVVDRLIHGQLVAPNLLTHEIANISVVKSRREPARAGEIASAIALRYRLKIDEMPVDHRAVVALARAKGLSAYDASYLWLALALNAELVTLDKALARAWAAEALPPPSM